MIREVSSENPSRALVTNLRCVGLHCLAEGSQLIQFIQYIRNYRENKTPLTKIPGSSHRAIREEQARKSSQGRTLLACSH
jgi:hypothetical protein